MKCLKEKENFSFSQRICTHVNEQLNFGRLYSRLESRNTVKITTGIKAFRILIDLLLHGRLIGFSKLFQKLILLPSLESRL